MNPELKQDIIDLFAQPEQAGVTALIIRDLVEKLRLLMDETPLSQMRLAGFRQYVERIEAVGWVYDPTAYRAALQMGDFEKLKAQLDMLQKLADFFQIPEGAD